MDLRNINRLLSILCICMYCKQCSVRIEVFKYNCRSSCQFRRIQCIRQRNSHVMWISCKCSSWGNGLSINQNRLSCRCIHQRTANSVFGTNLKCLHGNQIGNCYFLIGSCYMILSIIACCSCMYGRKILSLLLIFQISMDSYFLAICVHMLKCYSGLSCQRNTWELECNLNRSIWLLSSKFIRCSNLFSCIIQKCFSSFLINKCSRYRILTTNFQSIITNCINKCNLLIGCCIMATIFRVDNGCLDTRNIDRLIGVWNIGMRCNCITI